MKLIATHDGRINYSYSKSIEFITINTTTSLSYSTMALYVEGS